MRNIYLVTKHEIVTTIGKRSFWVMTLIFPAVILLLNIGSQLIAQSAIEETDSFLPGESQELPSQAIGLVDSAGLLENLPPGLPEGLLLPFADEAAALSALQSGAIGSYYLIPSDYIASGKVVGVAASFKPFGVGTEGLLEYLISYNMLGDPQKAALAIDPLARLEQTSLVPDRPRDASNPLTFFIPFGTMFIFFFLITMSSGFMLQSVSKEKENRTAEVLLLSLRPRDLMLGKILGLSVVALMQMAIWFGGALLVLDQSQQFLQTAASFTLPPGFAIWGVLYFLFGYLLYASLMGAIGALAPSAREGGTFTLIVLLPLMLPLWLNNTVIQSPNGPLATFLSLFPLTAPVSMITRLSSVSLPIWQPLLGVVLLAATAYLVVLLAARFFRADTLLSETDLDWKRLRAEFRR